MTQSMLLGSDTAEAHDSAAFLQPALISRLHGEIATGDRPVAILALMMFLVPALGVPSDLMLQDTLKSALADVAGTRWTKA